MAQLVRAPPCHGGGHRFKSVLGRLPKGSVFQSADVAQLAEQLICNQQVIGSSPIIGSKKLNKFFMDGFPSGQRGQTVNLLQIASMVRIHLHPLPTGTNNAG